MYNKEKKRAHKGRDPPGPTARFCTKRLLYFPLIFLLATALFTVSDIQIETVEGATPKKLTFRPFYEPYGRGTTILFQHINCTTKDGMGFHREWNLEGWDVSKIRMQFRFCVPSWCLPGYRWSYPFSMTLYFSLDRGETFSISREMNIPSLYFDVDNDWGEEMDYADFFYEFPSEDFGLFTLDTRLKFEFDRGYEDWYWYPNGTYLANCYWSKEHTPIPPHDFIDEQGGFVQYYMLFQVEYEESNIEYKGPINEFPYLKTKARLLKAGKMIMKCTHPSGCVNEVVITDISWGKNSWVIIYSSQLAMMELLDLCSIAHNEYSNACINTYLLSTKRFIEYMFSKQNLTDGSFPFILTDGDQHCWSDNETNRWYGYDKIDSFSACAISLVRKYYDVTADMTLLNKYWSNIKLCEQFIYDLTNQTIWLPVDGYHYNGTHYIKSEWNWLHDVCEAYQGLKDLSYLYGVKGDSGNQTYWNNFAEAIAESTRERMWNQTLFRYVGMYNVQEQKQESVIVYNVITPTIYKIETNATRASMTVQTYLTWGIMSGRYLNASWAQDYSVYNEYSSMGSMCLSAFAELNQTHHYHNQWMNDKFDNITRFIFKNPIYPKNNGDLQNANGLLDWVNLVNKTWAWDYARLIETSAWFIDGFMKLPYLVQLFDGEEPWWEIEEEVESWVGSYTLIGLGFGGLFLMVFAPTWVALMIRKKGITDESVERFGFAFLLFLVGFCLVITWLWS